MRNILIASAGVFTLSTAAFAQTTDDPAEDIIPGPTVDDDGVTADESWRADQSLERGDPNPSYDQGDAVDAAMQGDATVEEDATDQADYGRQDQAASRPVRAELAQSPYTQQELQSLRNLVAVTTYPVVQLGDRAILSKSAKTADKLIGKDVVDAQDRRIGNVRDIVLSQDGQVQSVIVGTGGFLGFNAREVEVGFDRLSMTKHDKSKMTARDAGSQTSAQMRAAKKDDKLTLAVTQDQLRQMPAFEREAASGEIFVSDLIDGEVELGAGAAGDAAQTRRLRDIVMDNEGRARFAVLESGAGDPVLIPYSEVRVAQGGEGLYVDMNATEIADAVKFTDDLDDAAWNSSASDQDQSWSEDRNNKDGKNK